MTQREHLFSNNFLVIFSKPLRNTCMDHLQRLLEPHLKMFKKKKGPKDVSLLSFFCFLFFEIAHYNMPRIRVVWAKIWTFMAEHFLYASCHSNIKISIYAVDSLRQLSEKFLDKVEFANYNVSYFIFNFN